MLLLDRQIYLWYLVDSPRMTQEISEQISGADMALVSAASIWEAAIKIGVRKLDAKISDLVKGIEASGFSELPVSAEDASMAASLPRIHHDPFDRLLVAQALAGPFRLLTADSTVARYSDVVQLVTYYEVRSWWGRWAGPLSECGFVSTAQTPRSAIAY